MAHTLVIIDLLSTKKEGTPLGGVAIYEILYRLNYSYPPLYDVLHLLMKHKKHLDVLSKNMRWIKCFNIIYISYSRYNLFFPTLLVRLHIHFHESRFYVQERNKQMDNVRFISKLSIYIYPTTYDTTYIWENLPTPISFINPWVEVDMSCTR